MLLLVVLPYLATCVAWLIGRAVLAALRTEIACEAFPILIGTASILLVVANLSFAGVSLGMGAVAVVCGLAAILIYSQRTSVFRSIDRIEVLILSGIVLVCSLSFLVPEMVHRSHLALLEAGDFWSYATTGSWLQHNSIENHVDAQTAFNPVLSRVMDFQLSFLRPGALFLYSFYSSAAGMMAPVAYSSYVAWLVALNAVAMYFFVAALSGPNNVLASTITALLYGLSPTLTWSAYAAFVPQALGFAFMTATIALVIQRAQDIAFGDRSRLIVQTLIVPLAILFGANWSAYPEVTPVVLCILGLYLLATFYRHLSDVAFLSRLLILAGTTIVACFVLSPMGFLWGMKGMIVQLAGAPHGGEQIITVYNIFRTMAGASLEPLIPESLDRATFLTQAGAPAILFCATIGIIHFTRSGRAGFVFAVSATAVLLFGYVAHHYGLKRYSDLPDGKALLTWNEFKAAQYIMVPFFAVGIGGLIHFAARANRFFRPAAASLCAVAVIVLSMAPIIVRQDQRVLREAYPIRFTSALLSLANLGKDRVLFDLGDDSQTNRYLKWAIYSLLPDAYTVSTTDTAFYIDDFTSNVAMHKAFLRAPFDYILTRFPERYVGASRVAIVDSFELLDVDSVDFKFSMGGNYNPTFVNFHRGATTAQRAFGLSDLARSKVDIQTSGRAYTANNSWAPISQIEVPDIGAGGVVQIIQPQQRNAMHIVLEHDFMKTKGDVLVPVFNVLPTLSAALVPKDSSGRRLLRVTPQPTGVRLAMDAPGFARIMLPFRLAAGEYYLRFEFGDVSARRVQQDVGYGAYIAADNKPETAIDLDRVSNSIFYYRIVLDHEGSVEYGLGFGAWGAASGVMNIKAIELLKR